MTKKPIVKGRKNAISADSNVITPIIMRMYLSSRGYVLEKAPKKIRINPWAHNTAIRIQNESNVAKAEYRISTKLIIIMIKPKATLNARWNLSRTLVKMPRRIRAIPKNSSPIAMRRMKRSKLKEG